MEKLTNAPALHAPIMLTSLTHESSADFILPEYMPPIRRIVSVEAVPLPESRFLNGSALELGGTLAYAVLYIGEDSAVSCASVTADYTASCALGDTPIADAARVCVDTVAENITCRVTAPRAFTVRTRMKTQVQAFAPRPIEEKITDSAGARPTAADVIALERLSREANDAIRCRGESTVTVSGSVSTAPVSKFIRASGAVRVDEAKADDGTIRLRGEVLLHALCLSPDGRFIRVDAKAPLDESVPVTGAMEHDAARGWGRVAAVTVHPGETDGAIPWEIEVDLEAESARPGKIAYTADAYSTACASEITAEEADSLTLLRCANCALTVSGEGGRQSKPQSGESVVDVTATAAAERMEARDAHLILHGTASVAVLLAAEGDLISEEFTIPFRCEMPSEADAEGELLWRCVPQVIAADARPAGDKLAVHLELAVSTSAVARGKIRCVTGVTLDKNAPHHRREGEIRICFPSPGEPLWEIAKRYAVPRSRLGDADLADGEPVLV